MKTPNKKNKNILLIPLAIFILALVSVSTVYALSGSIFGWDPLNQSESADEKLQQDQDENARQIKENSVVNNKGGSGSDQPAAPQTQTDGRQRVELDISSVNQIDSIIRIRTLISHLSQTGDCTVSVTNKATGESLYSATAGVQAMNNTATCKGFDIPTDSLGGATDYTITVAYDDGDFYGEASYSTQ